MAGDLFSVENDNQAGQPLIHQIMRGGKRLSPTPTLGEIRAHAAHELQRLPAPLHDLEPEMNYPVEVGEALKDLAAAFDRRLKEHEWNPE